jgi:tRNA (mo5U34)-methyltransferase
MESFQKLMKRFRRLLAPFVRKQGCTMNAARKLNRAARAATLAKIEELGPWFHNYEIADGIWTNPSGRSPGVDYPLWRWRLVEPLLPDLKGKSCLDVGCSSGFFSLKLKELGAADVLGVDFGEQTRAIDQARFAAVTLDLDVQFRTLSVYELRTLNRPFDLVLFMGVFYHLRHPLLALEAVRAVCQDTMMFQTITTQNAKALSEPDADTRRNIAFRSPIMTTDQFPALRFVEGALDGDVTCWFVPNVQGAASLLRSCGFGIDKIIFPTEHEIIARCSVSEVP